MGEPVDVEVAAGANFDEGTGGMPCAGEVVERLYADGCGCLYVEVVAVVEGAPEVADATAQRELDAAVVGHGVEADEVA